MTNYKLDSRHWVSVSGNGVLVWKGKKRGVFDRWAGIYLIGMITIMTVFWRCLVVHVPHTITVYFMPTRRRTDGIEEYIHCKVWV